MDKIIPIVSKISHTLGEMEELAKEHFGLQELTLTQMHYLEVMNSLQNPNITELASALQLTKPTVTVALDKLIEKEYLVKVQSDADAHLPPPFNGKRTKYKQHARICPPPFCRINDRKSRGR